MEVGAKEGGFNTLDMVSASGSVVILAVKQPVILIVLLSGIEDEQVVVLKVADNKADELVSVTVVGNLISM